MKPKHNYFGNEWDDFHENLEDYIEREAYDEDDQIEREREMRLDTNKYDEDADDLSNINIG